MTKWKVMGRTSGYSAGNLTAGSLTGGNLTWLALEPLTGRTHQLRVHCAETGWPILGDGIYGHAPRHGGPPLHLHAREVAVPLYKNRAADPRHRAGAGAHARTAAGVRLGRRGERYLHGERRSGTPGIASNAGSVNDGSVDRLFDALPAPGDRAPRRPSCRRSIRRGSSRASASSCDRRCLPDPTVSSG